MDSFLEVFGGVTIKDVALVVCALAFLYAIYKKFMAYLSAKLEEEQSKNERISTVLSLSEKYPQWRQQSMDIQKQLNGSINDLRSEQKRIIAKLNDMEKSNREREQNKIRDRLLQSYRYYSSKEKNPQQAWSEMEADAFWQMYKDYKELGGNGHIHTEVVPVMRSMEVIPMSEPDQIAELMHSRG